MDAVRPHRPLRLVVLCPHFDPDTAPTGVVIGRIVDELVALGHEINVVTALPWYRDHAVVAEWSGRWIRREQTTWGSITRVHPFPGSDRTNLLRRAVGFAGFSVLAAFAGVRGGRVDGVVSMSPPLTNGLIGWLIKIIRRGPLVFNIQDVFPDAAIQTGALTNGTLIRIARWLELISYRSADAVTVLSADLRDNVVAKVGAGRAARVRVIPNFVLTDDITPMDRLTAYRAELGIGSETVVMYAGNVGFSQSLDLLVHAAKAFPDVTFVINGEGVAKHQLVSQVAELSNVRLGDYQPMSRLAEVLATGDIHVVPLKAGLGSVSVPSKTYSILAAGRPALASIDAGTEVPRILRASGAGVSVLPDDPAAFISALGEMLADSDECQAMGRRGRKWVLGAASPRAVAQEYEALLRELGSGQRR